MGIRAFNSYEDQIDKMISQYGEASISDGIRTIVREYNTYAAQIFYDPLIIKSAISMNEGIARITAGDLKKLVKDSLLFQLNNEINYCRAEIIFKHLNNFYSGERASTQELESEYQKIRSENTFPTPKNTNHREGDEGKYKALANLLVKDNLTSKDHTLKFGMAVLGIKPEEFLNFLKSGSNIKYEKNQSLPGNEKEIYSNTKKFIFITFIGTLLLASIGIISKIIFHSNEETNDQISSRQEILTSSIFGSQIRITDTSVDTAYLMTTNTSANSFIQAADVKLPINEVILRFKLVNQTDDFLFPDNLDLVITNVEPIDYQLFPTTSAFQSEDIVMFAITPDQNQISTVLINNANYKGISPQTETHGVIKIKADHFTTNQIIKYSIDVRLHSSSKNYNFILPNKTLIVVASEESAQ